ncbi:xanthine dehydrogenase accessory protein XdhC [Alkalilimnicola ehrlichii]|uniref:Xanthine dehydrogenase accessory protein XdhC n=1 Tax=Alkalilimnicola ehrlichii TaxID=351052 RepID=A0A3E0X1U8_9GAMM|nr:xanthine dehydrogenase accessory protein XdhC [Alkalilimnicola ehrlichii]RFA28414.1 xanthine dehydrogenase accessory protein XdhC [Alkalilimnicola ehrlichii]RFA38518.1 xanthine dehydrogenase accessory protein XdhC [Alkalilimnicola ehrlichii]
MTHWLETLEQLLREGEQVVRIVVSATRGSAPREVGATMLIHRHGTFGTIGGGHLEYTAIDLAQRLLRIDHGASQQERFVLSSALGQCCGGIVNLWWDSFGPEDCAWVRTAAERLSVQKPAYLLSGRGSRALVDTDSRLLAATGEAGAALVAHVNTTAFDSLTVAQSAEGEKVLVQLLDDARTPLWLFGAGHVGKALLYQLRFLPFRVTWVDSRQDYLPARLPPNVRPLWCENPASLVRSAPDDAWFLVLTHDHEQDFRICHALLQRPRLDFAGLIGSRAKATRFAQRLARLGHGRRDFDRITCPIGIPGIRGKEPAMIAAAVTAQLLQQREWLIAHDAPPFSFAQGSQG